MNPVEYYIVIFILLGVALGMIWAMLAPFVEASNEDSHGSARFAKLHELNDLTKNTIPQESRLELGYYDDDGHKSSLVSLSEQRQESHVLLVAPTGKGKTSGIIIPALLSEQGNRSLFINDVKGELIQKCAGALAEHHSVLVFSPTRPHQSHAYNPLAHVHTMVDAEDLAACLVTNTGISQEPFWNDTVQQLLTASILHLTETEDHPPFSRLIEIVCDNDFDDLKNLFASSISQLARATALGLFKSLKGNERTASNVLTGFQPRFYRFRNPDIQQVTSTDDIDFQRLADTPTALILSIPASDAQRLKPLSAALIMQLMNYLTKRAENSPNGRLSRPFALYLDELTNVGKIRNFAQHLSLVRSAGIAIIAAIQDFGQLRREYDDDDTNSILANTTTHIVFPGCGLQETKYYSEKLGDKTITTSSTSFGDSSTTTYSDIGRRLMTPDEIRTMQPGKVLVIMDTLHPFLVQNVPYFKQPKLMKRVSLPYALPVRSIPPTIPLQLPPTIPPTNPPQLPPQQNTNTNYLSPE